MVANIRSKLTLNHNYFSRTLMPVNKPCFKVVLIHPCGLLDLNTGTVEMLFYESLHDIRLDPRLSVEKSTSFRVVFSMKLIWRFRLIFFPLPSLFSFWPFLLYNVAIKRQGCCWRHHFCLSLHSLWNDGDGHSMYQLPWLADGDLKTCWPCPHT